MSLELTRQQAIPNASGTPHSTDRQSMEVPERQQRQKKRLEELLSVQPTQLVYFVNYRG